MSLEGAFLKNPNPGNFAGVPQEMTHMLMRSDLTNREFRIVFFLFDEIVAKQYKSEMIKIEQFVEGTSLPSRHVIPAIKSLIKKGIIKRQSTSFRGTYFYQFHETNFGRVVATKEVYESKKGLKLLQGGKNTQLPDLGNKVKFELPKIGNSNENPLPDLGNSSRLDSLTDSLREIFKSPEVNRRTKKFDFGDYREPESWELEERKDRQLKALREMDLGEERDTG